MTKIRLRRVSGTALLASAAIIVWRAFGMPWSVIGSLFALIALVIAGVWLLVGTETA